jgi:cytochrome o ubiquinol oxidase subunit III
MSSVGVSDDPHHLSHGHSAAARDAGGIAPKRIIVSYGFWLFLVSDIIMFSAFFAAYAVLVQATAGGPTGRDLFKLKMVAIETALLLTSSFTCGLAVMAASARNMDWTQRCLCATLILGAAFLCIEMYEFSSMIGAGAGPQRSAFLSAFFALVGCHGLHVGAGILWCGTMMAQIWTKGFKAGIMRRLFCFGLFWHALDIVWIGVFTVVYLIGARA